MSSTETPSSEWPWFARTSSVPVLSPRMLKRCLSSCATTVRTSSSVKLLLPLRFTHASASDTRTQPSSVIGTPASGAAWRSSLESALLRVVSCFAMDSRHVDSQIAS